MAHSASARKRLRQSTKQRVVNRASKSRVKTSLKSFQELIQKGDKPAALKMQPAVQKIIDKAMAAGVYKKNTASRLKSGMMRSLNNLA